MIVFSGLFCFPVGTDHFGRDVWQTMFACVMKGGSGRSAIDKHPQQLQQPGPPLVRQSDKLCPLLPHHQFLVHMLETGWVH